MCMQNKGIPSCIQGVGVIFTCVCVCFYVGVRVALGIYFIARGGPQRTIHSDGKAGDPIRTIFPVPRVMVA